MDRSASPAPALLRPVWLIGFTGNRSGLDEVKLRPVLAEVLRELQQQAELAGGRAELYTSIAEGADTLCVEVAREIGMPVHLLLPLPEIEFEKDFSDEAAWHRAKNLWHLAGERPGRDSLHEVLGEVTRPDCYFNQGHRMLTAVDVLVALWNQQPTGKTGGTGDIVAQARALSKPVWNIHIATGAYEVPPGLDRIFRPDPIMQALNNLAAECEPTARSEARTPEELQERLDALAMHEAGRFRPTQVRVIMLHGIAALLAALVTYKAGKGTLWDAGKWVVTLVELFLVCIALRMNFNLKRRLVQDRWQRTRFACELVRGLRASVPLLDPLHPGIARQEPAWERFARSAGLLVQEHQTVTDILQLRDRYLDMRLGETHPDSQLKHYRERRPAALWWWEFTGKIGQWSAWLATVFIVIALLNKLSKHWAPPDGLNMESYFPLWLMVVFLPIALPLAAGVANSLRFALDAGRRKERYPRMLALLEEIRTSLPGLKTASTIRASITRSEELLHDELLDWKLSLRQKGR